MNDLDKAIKHIKEQLGDNIKDAKLGNEFFYQSITLAAIDTIYSAQSHFSTVQAINTRYCKKYNLVQFREIRNELPPKESQEKVKDLINRLEEKGTQFFVNEIFNKTKIAGRLKAEIVVDLLKVLDKSGIQTFQDINQTLNNQKKTEKLVSAITAIHGIGPALYRYFLMLSGDDNLVKPDTMILRFLSDCLGRKVREEEAVLLIQEAAKILKKQSPNLTPRLLDYVIWNYQRNKSQDTNNKLKTVGSYPLKKIQMQHAEENNMPANARYDELLLKISNRTNSGSYNNLNNGATVLYEIMSKQKGNLDKNTIKSHAGNRISLDNVPPTDYCYNKVNLNDNPNKFLIQNIDGTFTFKDFGWEPEPPIDVTWKPRGGFEQIVGSYDSDGFHWKKKK